MTDEHLKIGNSVEFDVSQGGSIFYKVDRKIPQSTFMSEDDITRRDFRRSNDESFKNKKNIVVMITDVIVNARISCYSNGDHKNHYSRDKKTLYRITNGGFSSYVADKTLLPISQIPDHDGDVVHLMDLDLSTYGLKKFSELNVATHALFINGDLIKVFDDETLIDHAVTHDGIDRETANIMYRSSIDSLDSSYDGPGRRTVNLRFKKIIELIGNIISGLRNPISSNGSIIDLTIQKDRSPEKIISKIVGTKWPTSWNFPDMSFVPEFQRKK